MLNNKDLSNKFFRKKEQYVSHYVKSSRNTNIYHLKALILKHFHTEDTKTLFVSTLSKTFLYNQY